MKKFAPIVIFLLLAIGIYAATVSHQVSEIFGLSFNDISLQKNNEVALFLNNTEAGGRKWALVSAGSLGGIGLGKFSIYDKTAEISSFVIDTAGNIGIGTTNPLYKLYVLGDIGWSGTLQSGSVPWARIIGAPNFLTSESDPTVKSWAKTDNPNIPGALTVNGNVGIGTANPQAKLDVAGNIRLSTGGTAAPYVLERVGSGTWNANCPVGDSAVSYRTIPNTCAANLVVCGSCTTSSHDWGTGQTTETCTYFMTAEDNSCAESFTCYAKQMVLCNP